MSGYATDAWPFAGAAAMLLAGGVASWLLAVWWTGRLMHRPPRLTPPRAMMRLGRSTPDDIGVAFEERVYEVDDVMRPGHRLQLDAWWLPAEQERATAVVVHSYGDSRPGVLPWAAMLHKLNMSVLVIDQRAHGTSGGHASTGGYAEQADLNALLNQLRPTGPLMLVGISFGAMVAADVAASRDDVAALVLDSPIMTWNAATLRWAKIFGLPPAGPLAQQLRLVWSVPAAGRRSPLETMTSLATMNVPNLVILPRQDVLVTTAEADAVAAMAHLVVWRPDVPHNLAIIETGDTYLKRIEDLLDRLTI